MNARRLSGIDSAIDRASWTQWLLEVNHIISILESQPNIVRPAEAVHGFPSRLARTPSHPHTLTPSHPHTRTCTGPVVG